MTGSGTGTVRITDDDEPVPTGTTLTVVLSVPDGTATEGDADATAKLTLTVSRGLGAGEELEVPLGFAGGVLGTDFTLALDGTPEGVTLSAGVVTFTGGATASAEAASVEVTAAEDADGVDEVVTVTIPAGTTGNGPTLVATGLNGGVTGSGTGTVRITDDDDAALVVDPASLELSEGGAAKTYTVKLATEPSGEVTVTVASGGAAVTVDDTDAVKDGRQDTLTFTATTWDTAQTVTVRAPQNGADASDAKVTVSNTAAGADYGSVSADVVVTVLDDDATTVVLTVPDGTATEGDADATAKLTLTVSRGLGAGEELEVPLGFAGGVLGTDFTLALDGTPEGVTLSAGVVTFTGGATASAEAASVEVTAAEDADGVDEVVTVTIPAGTTGNGPTLVATGLNGGVTGSGTGTVRITDDDDAALVVDPASLELSEGGAAKTYTVKLATEPSGEVTVTISGQSGTDVSVDKTTLRFAVAQWSEAQTVTVTAREDDDAADDRVTLRHAASGGDYGGVTADVDVTVTDDDELSTAVILSLNPTAVSEGAERTEVTVTAALNDATLPTDVVVQVTVAAGSAGAEDFAAVTPFALTIGAGATRATAAFTFTPVDDVIDEPDETVAVSGRITAPSDSTLTVTPAVLTILDDDETPAISIADAGAVESAGEIVFPVTLSGASAQTITVSYRTADGTAEAGTDYESGDGELRFAPGETERSVTIAVIDDELDEADETFLVQLGEAGHATVADGEATGTITDEDEAPLITIEDATVVESSERIGFLVTLDAPSGRPISVVCRSADGTAIAGDDYMEEVGLLRFEPGETQKTIRMEVIDDAMDEDSEHFLLNLSEPTNVRLAAEVVSAVGTIEDDDAAVTVAWLARFGRTVTQQVLEAVGERTQGGPALGSQVSLVGHRVNAGSLAVGGDDEETESDVLSGRSGAYRIVSGGELLAESSFLVAAGPEAGDGVTEEAAEGVRWTLWGRGAAAGFDGLDEGGRLSIDGSVLTGLAGVDAGVGGWLGGLAVGRSDGNGGYGWAAEADRPTRAGDLEADLTSVYPYLRVPVADWLSVWGVFGYGVGELRQVEEERLEEQTSIGMLLGALGGRGELLSGGGVELAVKADGYLLRMTSESTPVLPIVEADVMRLRLTAEGSGQVRIGSGLVVRPSVEVGVRHDGGDVENGTGVELGGGLSVTDLAVGLALSGSARVLMTHEDRGYREWGAAGALSFDPGEPERGLAVKVDSSYGASASGAEQLWSQGAADPAGAAVPVGRVAAELGYGVAETDWSVRPYASVELAGDNSPTWRVGTRFGLGAQDVTVEGSGTTGSAAMADSNLTIEYSVRW